MFAVLPYISIPTLKIFAATFIINQILIMRTAALRSTSQMLTLIKALRIIMINGLVMG